MRKVIRFKDSKEMLAEKFTGDLEAFDVPWEKELDKERGTVIIYPALTNYSTGDTGAIMIPKDVTIIYDEEPTGKHDTFFHLVTDEYFFQNYGEKPPEESVAGS